MHSLQICVWAMSLWYVVFPSESKKMILPVMEKQTRLVCSFLYMFTVAECVELAGCMTVTTNMRRVSRAHPICQLQSSGQAALTSNSGRCATTYDSRQQTSGQQRFVKIGELQHPRDGVKVTTKDGGVCEAVLLAVNCVMAIKLKYKRSQKWVNQNPPQPAPTELLLHSNRPRGKHNSYKYGYSRHSLLHLTSSRRVGI